MTLHPIEKDYLATIQAAYAISAMSELWYAMTQLSAYYITCGWTQTASDILAFVLLQENVPQDTHDQAYDLFDDLERSICPRVIWDARQFAQDMDLIDMIDYLLDSDNAST